MKTIKLSLITAIAVGSITSFATASDATDAMTGIEEALKDVKIDGFARYRFNDYDSKSNDNKKGFNHLDLDLRVHVTVGDNVVVTTGVAGRGTYYASGNTTPSGNGEEINIPDFYATYTLDKLTVTGGKMALGLPITDNGYRGTRGVGLNASYDFGNVTILGAYYNGIDNLGSASEVFGGASDLQNDTSAVAVLGSWGMVDAQVWGMKVNGEIDSMIFADVGLNHSGFFVKGQAIHTTMDEDSDYMTGNPSTENSGTFYAAKAGWDNSRYRVNVALVSNDDKMAIHGIDHDVDTNVIHVGYRLSDDFGTQGGQEGMDAMGIDAGATYGKYSFDAGYAKATDMTNLSHATDTTLSGDATEYWGKVGYAYNKKIDTYLAYSDISSDNDALDQKFVRFEVKYKF